LRSPIATSFSKRRVPTSGEQLDLMTFASLTGKFNKVVANNLAAGLTITAEYEPSGVPTSFLVVVS
jgi:hypothetical protein